MPHILLKTLIHEGLDSNFYREIGNPFMGEVKDLENEIENRYPEIKELRLSGKLDSSISIHSIRIKPEHHGKGIGSKIISDIKNFARQNRVPITLSPEADRGKKEELRNFYKKNGFVKCKDSRLTSMFAPVLIWYP